MQMHRVYLKAGTKQTQMRRVVDIIYSNSNAQPNQVMIHRYSSSDGVVELGVLALPLSQVADDIHDGDFRLLPLTTIDIRDPSQIANLVMLFVRGMEDSFGKGVLQIKTSVSDQVGGVNSMSDLMGPLKWVAS